MCAGPSRVGRRGNHQRKGYGDAPRAAPRLRWGAADERRYSDGDQISRGVQGSIGPLVGVHRIETVGPLVLSVTKEQRCNEKMADRWPQSQTRQLTYKTNPAKANKEKNQRPRRGRVRGVSRGKWSRKARQTNFGSVRGVAGRGVDRGRQGNGRGEAGGRGVPR